jgi:hypothetical protein
MKVLDRVSSGVALLTGIALLLAGCAPALDLEPYSMQDSRPLANATDVVVGVIFSDMAIRQPMHSRLNGGYPMRLCKLELRLENILKGDLKAGTAAVYYFSLAGGTDGVRPLGQWEGANRRILWLRRDSGVLRTACDGHDGCTWPVRSGAHPQYRANPRKPIGYALVDLLFSKGEGTTDSDLARGIEEGISSNEPEAHFFEKLQDLAATGSPIVRAAACRQLSYYHQKCVDAGS